MSLVEVLAYTRFSQRALFYLVKHRRFPQPIRTKGICTWLDYEVNRWLRWRDKYRPTKAEAWKAKFDKNKIKR